MGGGDGGGRGGGHLCRQAVQPQNWTSAQPQRPWRVRRAFAGCACVQPESGERGRAAAFCAHRWPPVKRGAGAACPLLSSRVMRLLFSFNSHNNQVTCSMSRCWQLAGSRSGVPAPWAMGRLSPPDLLLDPALVPAFSGPPAACKEAPSRRHPPASRRAPAALCAAQGQRTRHQTCIPIPTFSLAGVGNERLR